MHEELIIYAGNKINAKKALIMLHGRGANAEDILSLAENLDVTDYLQAAPQASGNSWYPNSFLAIPRNNEPWLSSALDLVHIVVGGFIKQGIKKKTFTF